MSESPKTAPPNGVIGYVVDMLSELADMAALNGYRSVAVSIRLAALQASSARDHAARSSKARDILR